MNKMRTVGSLLLASVGCTKGMEGFIGTPTGTLDPQKRRQLESILKQRNAPETVSSGPANPDVSRDLYRPYDDYYYDDYMPYGHDDYAYGYDYYGKKGYRYGDDDDYYAPKNGYGGKKRGKGKGGKKKAKSYANDNACELFVTEEHFRFGASNVTIPVMDGGNSTDIGTKYIWAGQYLEDPASMHPLGAMIHGTCTRTLDAGDNSAGQCDFTIIETSKGTYDQMQFSGVLQGAGGNLLITGGSGNFVGLIGDAKIMAFPGGDPLEDASFYDVTLVIGLIVCPPQFDPNAFGITDDHYYYYP